MIKKTIKLDELNLEYILEIKKIKHTYLKIREGKIIVSTNKKTNINDIEKLLLVKKEWIKKCLDYKNKLVLDDNKIVVFGEMYVIIKKYNLENNLLIKEKDKIIEIDLNICEKLKENFEIKDYIYEYVAKLYLKDIVSNVSNLTKIYPTKLIIKNLKSAWGMCKTNGNITINSKVFMFNIKVVEYVVIHELCHIKHHNHSKLFWNEVEKYEPEYKSIRKLMKNYYKY